MGVDTARVVHSELLEESLRDLICVFCSDLIDPHDALQAPCGHAFCSACIAQAIDTGYRACPLDKKGLKAEELQHLKDVNLLLYQLLGRTLVRCVNFNDGCGWRGDLFDAPDHLKQCETQGRHCQCCKMRRDELKAAKELIVGYERMVSENKKEMRSLKERVQNLQAQLTAAEARSRAHPGHLGRPLLPLSAGTDGDPSGLSWPTPSAPPMSRCMTGLVPAAATPFEYPGFPSPSNPSLPSLDVAAAAEKLQKSSLRPTAGPSSSPALDYSERRPGTSSGPLFGGECPPGDAWANGNRVGIVGIGKARSATPDTTSPRSPSPIHIPRQPWQGGIFSMTLHGHTTQVTSMAASPDGRTLFSGSLDGNLRVWRSGRCVLSQLGYHAGCILDLAYAADCDTLYSCGEDKVVRAWPAITRGLAGHPAHEAVNIEDGAVLAPIPLRLCAAAPNRLVVAYSDGRVIARENWRISHLIREKGPCSSALDAVASDCGTVFFSGSPDHSIWVHMWGKGTRQLTGHEADVISLATGPGDSLVSMSKDGVVKEWKDGAMVNSWSTWRPSVGLAVGFDGVVYCGREKEGIVQCRRAGQCAYILRDDSVCKEEAVVLAVGSEGLLYSGERSGAIRMWRCPD